MKDFVENVDLGEYHQDQIERMYTGGLNMGYIKEEDLFAYMKENPAVTQELYQALAGTDNGDQEKIEIRETSGAYFLMKENGVKFAFEKSEKKKK